jgi:hypothetical protein
MRIHGVHLNGLDSPRGVHQLACEPGYNAVVCPDTHTAGRLMELVRALLCDPGALEGRGRADLSLSLGGSAYRVVADLARGRTALARYEGDDTPRRVATGPGAILRALRAAGAPEDLATLCVWPPDEGWSELERRVKELEVAFAEFEPIAPELDGLEPRLDHWRGETAERERSRASILRHRTRLEAERARMAAPRARLAVGWSGALLALASVAGGTWLRPELFAFAGLGICVAAAGAWAVRAARLEFGRVEARLAMLRAAEREAEARFEREAGAVSRLMVSLDLDSADDLLRIAEAYRHAAHELEQMRGELERADAGGSDAAESDPLEAPIEAAARAVDADPSDLRTRLRPLLPVYLRALSGGTHVDAHFDERSGWWISPASGEPRRLDELEPEERAVVPLAFRLALLEGLARKLHVPLLVGPGAGESPALARALRRLGSVAQVIQFCAGEGDAAEHAHAVQRLDGP